MNKSLVSLISCLENILNSCAATCENAPVHIYIEVSYEQGYIQKGEVGGKSSPYMSFIAETPLPSPPKKITSYHTKILNKKYTFKVMLIWKVLEKKRYDFMSDMVLCDS